jgi:plastocyanin
MSEPSFARRTRAVIGTTLTGIAFVALGTTAHASTFIVNVGGAQPVFNPQTITIQPGDTVTFINKGGYHNVVADNGSFRCARGCDGQGGSGAASSFNWAASVTFPNAGTVGYFCEIHGQPGQGMFGTITVALPPPPPPKIVGVPNDDWKFAALLCGALALAAAAHLRRRRE